MAIDDEGMNDYHLRSLQDPVVLEKDVSDILSVVKKYIGSVNQNDMKSIRKLWSDNPSSVCLIPGQAQVSGLDRVVEAHQKAAKAAAASLSGGPRLMMPDDEDSRSKGGKRKVLIRDAHLSLRGSTAWVTTLEEIRATSSGPFGSVKVSMPKVRATHILHREGRLGPWKILVRHASYVPKAVSVAKGIKGGSKKQAPKEEDAGRIVFRATPSVSSTLDVTEDSAPSSSPSSTADPDIVVDQEQVSEVVSSLRNALTNIGKTQQTKDGTIVTEVTVNGVPVESSDFEEQMKSMMTPAAAKERGLWEVNGSSEDAESGEEEGSAADEDSEEDRGNAMVRKTVGALRKLCRDGEISPDQKRRLLSNVIRSASKEQPSMVEVAFELLLENSGADNECYEEFADQCRVLADSLAK
eukprot:CAMPEP_0113935854 /NCGR_PEP_ID=MMETSP1339-20121228/2908_1 /TAXON_ID=94617 /ORGANISM="Fibrocapsa japonica" /LENGTH=409 /DNA_ID=CAMNT_0000938141 /DNA_START=273 /DNA_END=1502 /DNA_ORIENTATION=- /assembly_acc=CAM_ASM_000762